MTEPEHALPIDGILSIDESQVAAIGAPDELVDFLVENGLPIFPLSDPPFGVVFEKPRRIEYKKRTYIVVAREVWGTDLLIGAELDSGSVYAITPDSGERPVYINSSVPVLLEFLKLSFDLLSRANAEDPDSGPRVLTAEEAKKRLDAFEKGLRPKAKVKTFDRERETRKVKKYLREIDAKALKSGTWWGNVLDELQDGLI